MAGGSIRKRDAIKQQRSARALQLRSQGLTYRQIVPLISEEFNQPRYNASLAHTDCKFALENIAIENTYNMHQLRKLELYRYEDYLNRIYPEVERGRLQAVDCAVRISQARARILGLYAPVEIKIQEIVSERVQSHLTVFFQAVNGNDLIPEHVRDMLYEIGEEVGAGLGENPELN